MRDKQALTLAKAFSHKGGSQRDHKDVPMANGDSSIQNVPQNLTRTADIQSLFCSNAVDKGNGLNFGRESRGLSTGLSDE